MNASFVRTGILAALIVALILVLASAFVVHQTQQAIVLRFGAVRNVIDKPGLYFKLPFVDTVATVEKRVLDLDLPVQTVLSTDRQNLEVDAFARYRITDPLRFYQAVGNQQNANARLSSFVNSNLRNVLANASFPEIIRTRRDELMNRIQDAVNRQSQNLGIAIVDVRLTRVDLPTANSEAVYNRMRTERQREAADLRAQGAQRAAGIKARADRDSVVIVAEATRRSEELRGEGDAERNRILAEAYGRDPDFFAFFRSMQAYENGLRRSRNGESRLVLSPDSEFFRYFNSPTGRGRENGAPAAPGTGPAPGSAPGASAPAPGPNAAATPPATAR